MAPADGQYNQHVENGPLEKRLQVRNSRPIPSWPLTLWALAPALVAAANVGDLIIARRGIVAAHGRNLRALGGCRTALRRLQLAILRRREYGTDRVVAFMYEMFKDRRQGKDGIKFLYT